jgi:uncharacterized protein DUF3551
MRATVSIAFALLLLSLAEAAAGPWCATYSRRGSENCGYATLDQCRAQVSGLGGWCRPNPFPGTAFGTSGTWSSGPRR